MGKRHFIGKFESEAQNLSEICAMMANYVAGVIIEIYFAVSERLR